MANKAITQLTTNTELANLLCGLRMVAAEVQDAKIAGRSTGDIVLGGRFFPKFDLAMATSLEKRLLSETVFLVILSSPIAKTQDTVRRMSPLVETRTREFTVYTVAGDSVENVLEKLQRSGQYLPNQDRVEECHAIQIDEGKDGSEQAAAFIHR